MPNKLIGTEPYQVPRNADLGEMAFQDSAAVNISGGILTGVHKINSEISENLPSFMADFAKTKSLDPRITYSRSSAATYYDGVSSVKSEENLLQYSEQFDMSYWFGGTSVSKHSNVTTAPNGTLTADLIMERDGTSRHGLIGSNATLALISGLSYTASCYFKTNGRTAVTITLAGNTSGAYVSATYDLSGVTVTQTNVAGSSFSHTSSSIVSVGDGWYRCILTGTTATRTDCLFGIYLSNSNTFTPDSVVGVNNYAGDVTKGVYVWGAQLEQRNSVSVYTPTTTSPIINYIPLIKTAPSNTPRFHHDFVTKESNGLLIEEARTNIVPNSSTHTGLENSTVLMTNAVRFIDGSYATIYRASPTLNVHRVLLDGISGGSGTTFVSASAYVKVPSGSDVSRLFFRVRSVGGSGTGCTFKVTNSIVEFDGGIIGAFGGTPPAQVLPNFVFVDNVGGGWYRIGFYSGVSSSSSDNVSRLDIGFANNLQEISVASPVTTIAITGWQLEVGSGPTSYIPTSGSQVTRAADAASIEGAYFSNMFRKDAGTLISHTRVPTFMTFMNDRYIASFTASSVVRRMPIRFGGAESGAATNRFRAFANDGANFVYAIDSTNGITGSDVSAIAYSVLNDFAGVMNGGDVVTDTLGSIEPIEFDRLFIGAHSNDRHLNGCIKKLVYYPIRLSNAELKEITAQ